MTIHSPFPPHGEPDDIDSFLFCSLPLLVLAVLIIAAVIAVLGG